LNLFKRNPFGHNLYVKKTIIRVLGVMSHRRYKGFNQLKIEGSEIIQNLPEKNVLFVGKLTKMDVQDILIKR
jgi:hypothetical protein